MGEETVMIDKDGDEELALLQSALKEICGIIACSDLSHIDIPEWMQRMLPKKYLGAYKLEYFPPFNMQIFKGNMCMGKPAGEGIMMGRHGNMLYDITMYNNKIGPQYKFELGLMASRKGIFESTLDHGLTFNIERSREKYLVKKNELDNFPIIQNTNFYREVHNWNRAQSYWNYVDKIILQIDFDEETVGENVGKIQLGHILAGHIIYQFKLL